MSNASGRTQHVPVLLNPLLKHLSPLEGKVIVDGTFGGGGMTRAFLQAGTIVIGFDQDEQALKRGQTLQEQYKENLTLVHSNFEKLKEKLKAEKVDCVDAVVLDLGMSSDQLADATRGFSFRRNGPLDMRMDQDTPSQSAADVLNTLSEPALADLFYKYGDEPKSRLLAREIVAVRKEKRIETTFDLLEIIEKIYPPRAIQKRSHPALRIFQALRIYVNKELEALENVLPQAADILSEGGKLAVITFHSIEDRMVKEFFREKTQDELDDVGRVKTPAKFKIFQRKIVPTEAEVEANPRSRSAHLRILQRVGL